MKSLISIAIASAVLIVAAPVAQADDWICALDADLQTAQRLFSVTQVEAVEFLSVSSDGKRFAFSGRTQKKADSRIWTCNLDGSNMRDLGRGTMPSWSPGAKRMVFSRTAPEPGIWMMRADGSDQQILDQQGWGAAWSPDGINIGWYRQVAGVVDIAVHNIAEDDFDLVFGAKESGLVFGQTPIAWSPDSRRITFITADSQNVATVSSVDLQSPKPIVAQHLTQASNVSATLWLNDQSLVFCQRGQKGGVSKLMTASADGDSGMISRPMRMSPEFEQRSNDSVSATKGGQRLFFLSRSSDK